MQYLLHNATNAGTRPTAHCHQGHRAGSSGGHRVVLFAGTKASREAYYTTAVNSSQKGGNSMQYMVSVLKNSNRRD